MARWRGVWTPNPNYRVRLPGHLQKTIMRPEADLIQVTCNLWALLDDAIAAYTSNWRRRIRRRRYRAHELKLDPRRMLPAANDEAETHADR